MNENKGVARGGEYLEQKSGIHHSFKGGENGRKGKKNYRKR